MGAQLKCNPDGSYAMDGRVWNLFMNVKSSMIITTDGDILKCVNGNWEPVIDSDFEDYIPENKIS